MKEKKEMKTKKKISKNRRMSFSMTNPLKPNNKFNLKRNKVREGMSLPHLEENR